MATVSYCRGGRAGRGVRTGAAVMAVAILLAGNALADDPKAGEWGRKAPLLAPNS